jgi:hypothetical protein
MKKKIIGTLLVVTFLVGGFALGANNYTNAAFDIKPLSCPGGGGGGGGNDRC